MRRTLIITPEDYKEYLLRLYFGSKNAEDPLSASIGRAYADFSHTLHGIKDVEDKSNLHSKAVNTLKAALLELKEDSDQIDQKSFDKWHETTCKKLILIYEKAGYHFHVGQAQKWINMALKYIFTFGEEKVPGFSAVYPFCHIPLDNIILNSLKKYNYPALDCAWSRLDDYNEYFDRQLWIRQHFETLPLDTEFLLWLGREVEFIPVKT